MDPDDFILMTPSALKLSFLFSCLSVCSGQEDLNHSLEYRYRLNGIETQRAFGDTGKLALDSSVRLIRNHKLIAMGTIISPDGFVLTKASSCVGARTALTRNGESFDLRIRKRFEELDLALYQLETERNDFECVKWTDQNTSLQNVWAISAHPSLKEIRVGISSGNSRKIEREGGVMGVVLGRDGKKIGGVEINEVIPHAAADRAGLISKDLILKLDGRKVQKRNQVTELLGSKNPGDMVDLEIVRKQVTKRIRLTLGHKSVTFDLFNRNLQMSGPVSKRKDDFPMILQHDLPLPKEAMGGPLLDLNGFCMGINVARVDRVTTFALPAKIIKPWIRESLPVD